MVEAKLEKMDTTARKKNLVIEGIPEGEGGMENVGKLVSNLFDQLRVNKEVNFEACYRLGSYGKNRARPILVSFERQVDRDFRSGKYSILLGKTRYDAANIDDLPKPLHSSSLKQIQIDDSTIAYQSEFAPSSNVYPCQVLVGSLRFICLEQTYQFLKAKIMKKPLAATHIYLSRDVIEMKQI